MLATSSVIEGDMIESSSPADPLFWLVHPVIERLLTAKRLPDVTSMGGTGTGAGAGVEAGVGGGKEVYKWTEIGGASEHWVAYSYYDLVS